MVEGKVNCDLCQDQGWNFTKTIQFDRIWCCVGFFFQIIYLFIFGGSVSSVQLMGFLKGGAQASHCRGFSCCGAWSNY